MRKVSYFVVDYTMLSLSPQVVVEKCVYRPSKDNKTWTECEKHAWIESNVYGFAKAIQSFGVERFKKNTVKASKGLEYILHKTYEPDFIPDQSLLLGKFTKENFKEKAQKKAAETLAKKAPIITT
jgi:hypothetical protein